MELSFQEKKLCFLNEIVLQANYKAEIRLNE